MYYATGRRLVVEANILMHNNFMLGGQIHFRIRTTVIPMTTSPPISVDLGETFARSSTRNDPIRRSQGASNCR